MFPQVNVVNYGCSFLLYNLYKRLFVNFTIHTANFGNTFFSEFTLNIAQISKTAKTKPWMYVSFVQFVQKVVYIFYHLQSEFKLYWIFYRILLYYGRQTMGVHLSCTTCTNSYLYILPATHGILAVEIFLQNLP